MGYFFTGPRRCFFRGGLRGTGGLGRTTIDSGLWGRGIQKDRLIVVVVVVVVVVVLWVGRFLFNQQLVRRADLPFRVLNPIEPLVIRPDGPLSARGW